MLNNLSKALESHRNLALCLEWSSCKHKKSLIIGRKKNYYEPAIICFIWESLNMKKMLLFIVLAFSLQVTYSFSTSYVRVIQSVQPLSAANISDDGNRMVFIGTYSKTQQGIFLSQAPLWQHVQAIIVTNRYLAGTKIKLTSFLNTTTQGSFTDFDGPAASDHYVAFAAMTNTHRFGLFYAEPGHPMWISHKIALVGDQFKKGVTFTSFSPPYTFQQHHLLFLATLSNGETGVFSYEILKHTLYEIVNSQHSKPSIRNLSDISVNQNDFVTRDIERNKMAVYVYKGDDDFKRISPFYNQVSTATDVAAVGTPSYVQVGETAYVIFPVAMGRVNGAYQHYSLFGNLSDTAYSAPLVTSGNAAPGTFSPFYKITNPTLAYNQDRFYFTFEATTHRLPNQEGAYLAKLDHNNLHLISLVDPATVFDGGKVKNAMLGSVSIRHNNIPVSVAFKSGYYGLYLFQLKD